jgi:hypothetical protein
MIPLGAPIAPVPSADPSSIFERSVQVQQTVPEASWASATTEAVEAEEVKLTAAAASGNPNHLNMVTRIPTHVLTEDHIPAVLEASTKAIVKGDDPENIEIVTHAAHLSLGETLGAAASSSTGHSPEQSPKLMPDLMTALKEHASMDEQMAGPPRPLSPGNIRPLLESVGEEGENPRGMGALAAAVNPMRSSPLLLPVAAPTVDDPLAGSLYGTRPPSSRHDANSPRRLSFVSFADVVHGEQGGATVLSTPSSGYSSPTGGAFPVGLSLTKPAPVSIGGRTAVASMAAARSRSASPPLPVGAAPSPPVVGSTSSPGKSTTGSSRELKMEKMSTAMRLAGRDTTE